MPRYICFSDQAHSLRHLLIKLIHNDQIRECDASSEVHRENQALYNACTVLWNGCSINVSLYQDQVAGSRKTQTSTFQYSLAHSRSDSKST